MKLEELSAGREKILSIYGKTQNDLDGDVKILKEWMQKQPHIPSHLIQDSFLEILLVKNKFSIEKSKKKLDSYCTLKGQQRYEQFYRSIPKPSKECVFYLPIPTLTPEGKRVIVCKLKNENDYDLVREIATNLFVLEFLARYDYNDGLIFIFDHSNISTSILSKFRANLVSDSFTMARQGFSARIQGIHMVNKIGAFVMPILKPILPQKLMSRMSFHNDFESLKDVVSPEYLPKEFGGTLKSYDEFLAEWDRIFEENVDFLKRCIDTKANEELRLSPSTTNNELQGTFKKLNID